MYPAYLRCNMNGIITIFPIDIDQILELKVKFT